MFVGHMSHGKYVPNEAFTAPDEFVIGLLNGYFSGDGSVRGNRIDANSVSYKLTHGIYMLCTRFGIFGKIAKNAQVIRNKQKNIQPFIYNIAISGHWSKIFAEIVPMMEKNKQINLNNITKFSQVKNHRNYSFKNDVVLDPVISIEKLDPANYLKVYDVTIPSTDNFQVFNGLNLKNTSETG
jgi:intein/homing endonuclease